jgi:Transposase.
MRRSRFSEEEIIGILRENQVGAKIGDLYRRHGLSDATCYTWRKKFGGAGGGLSRRQAAARFDISVSTAVTSIAGKIGCSAYTLLEWVKKAEVDSGERADVPPSWPIA